MSETLKRCSCCKSTQLLETYFTKNRKGEYYKTCNSCRVSHVCPQCEYTTSDKSHLRRHMSNVHDKMKPFQCPKCEKKFGQNSDLKTHISSVHDKFKPFQCLICDAYFNQNYTLQRHISFVHNKEKPIECPQCDHKCDQNSSLKTHIRAIHDKIKPFKCSTCEYKCGINSRLQEHIKICSGDLNISGGELACRKAIELLGFEYETEVCEIKNEDDKWLRFDFKVVVGDKSYYIEFDGHAHFKPVRFGGISLERAKLKFEKLKKHDKIKNDYCEEHNLPLLRIPYMRIDETMSLIREFLV
jgi:hypothetical protein